MQVVDYDTDADAEKGWPKSSFWKIKQGGIQVLLLFTSINIPFICS